MQISYWQEIHPVAVYLIAITVSTFETTEDTYTSLDGMTEMPVNYYLFPGQYASNQTSIDLTPDAIHCYASKYGEYPYLDEKYGMVSMPQGGGMEHQTCSTMGGYSEGTIVHELAHQWFGDLITCATWQDTWINEGGATYSEAIWYENTQGEEYLAGYMNQISTSAAYDLTPVTDQNYALTLTVYHKGSWIYHMIRYLLGDDVFFSTVQKLLHNSEYSYNSLTSEQFIDYFANESGVDLSDFYEQWVVKGGYPEYDFSYLVYNTATNASTLKIKVEQTLTDIRPIFTMPIPIKVEFMDGTDSILVVNNTQQSEIFEFNFGKEIKTDIPLDNFNYDSKILCKKTIVGYVDEPAILSEGFESSSLPGDWTVIYEDGDGNSWILKLSSAAHSGGKYVECKSSDTQSSDWLITPMIHLNNIGRISFFARSKGTTVLESFNFKLSDTGNDISDFNHELGSFTDISNEWASYFIDLGTEYAGKDIYLA